MVVTESEGCNGGGNGSHDARAAPALALPLESEAGARRWLTEAIELMNIAEATVEETLRPLPLLLSVCVEAD